MFTASASTVSVHSTDDADSSVKSQNCTVLLIRDRRPIARFSVPNDCEPQAHIKLCFAPLEFTALMHKMAIEGTTNVEMIHLDGSSYNYTFRG
jgi:hypothetical protein